MTRGKNSGTHVFYIWSTEPAVKCIMKWAGHRVTFPECSWHSATLAQAEPWQPEHLSFHQALFSQTHWKGTAGALGCSASSRLPSQLSTGCTGAAQKCCFRWEKISVPLLNRWCYPSREREIPAFPQVSDQRGLPEGCFHCKTVVMKNIMREKANLS